jgi:hypothetical protein
VVRSRAVPAAVLVLQRGMRPAIARVSGAEHDPLPGKTRGPEFRRMTIANSGLDRGYG